MQQADAVKPVLPAHCQEVHPSATVVKCLALSLLLMSLTTVQQIQLLQAVYVQHQRLVC